LYLKKILLHSNTNPLCFDVLQKLVTLEFQNFNQSIILNMMFRDVSKVVVIPTSWVSTLETNLKEIKVMMVNLCGVP
jgi:hypothetical protein